MATVASRYEHENRFAEIETKIGILKRMFGSDLALTAAVPAKLLV